MPTLERGSSTWRLKAAASSCSTSKPRSSCRQPELTPPPDEFARMVLEAIRKHHLESRVILQSFDFRTLIAMKKLAPEIKLSALYSGPAKDFVAIAKEADAANRVAASLAGHAGTGEGRSRRGAAGSAVDREHSVRSGSA